MKLLYILLGSIFINIPTFPQTQKIKEIEKITQEWAEANNTHDLDKVVSLYASTLNFYAINKDAATCIREKKAFFEKYPEYSISISNLDVDFYKSGIIRCSFVKNEVWNDRPRSPQQGYLLFEKDGSSYHIIAESDQRVDGQRGYVPQLGAKEEQKNISISVITFAAVGLIMLLGIVFLVKRKSKSIKQPLSSVNEAPLTKMQPTFQQKETQPPVKEQTSEEKGYDFEKFVVSKFSKEYFDIIEWRSDKFHKGIFAKNSMLPDLEISFSNKNVYNYFAVECKWQNNITQNKIEWAKDYQLKNYKDFEHATGKTVFIVIGIGGQPDSPREIYVLPLSKISSTVLYLNDIRRYEKRSEYFFYDPHNNVLT